MMADRSRPASDRAEEGTGESPERAAINPAARRDPPTPPAEEQEDHEPGDRPVPPEQGEPLDPLGPGGIGS